MSSINNVHTYRLIDLHVHLLPGLDDGPASMEAAVAAAREVSADGVGIVVCTPHLALGQYENTRDVVLDQVERFQAELDAEGIDLQVLPGCEALIHPRLPELLAASRVATMADLGRHLLLEIPWTLLSPAVPSLDRLLAELRQCGVQIILAHPERYELVQKDPDWLGKRVEDGLLVQVNAAHLLPAQTGTVGKTARHLLENRLVHFLGSDGHGSRRRPANLGTILRELVLTYGEHLADQAMTNAWALIGGQTEIVKPILL